jgi:hypothetical protein
MRDPNFSYEILPYFDLCLCLEVAEHVEKEYAEIFVENLCTLSRTIILSAAPPGQKGTGHVNCQPPKYWMNIFKSFGYDKNSVATELLKGDLAPWGNKPGIKAYYHNLIVFEKGVHQ